MIVRGKLGSNKYADAVTLSHEARQPLMNILSPILLEINDA